MRMAISISSDCGRSLGTTYCSHAQSEALCKADAEGNNMIVTFRCKDTYIGRSVASHTPVRHHQRPQRIFNEAHTARSAESKCQRSKFKTQKAEDQNSRAASHRSPTHHLCKCNDIHHRGSIRARSFRAGTRPLEAERHALRPEYIQSTCSLQSSSECDTFQLGRDLSWKSSVMPPCAAGARSCSHTVRRYA